MQTYFRKGHNNRNICKQQLIFFFWQTRKIQIRNGLKATKSFSNRASVNHYKKLRPPQTSNKMGSRAHWHICSRLFCTYFHNYVVNLLGNPPCSLPSRPFVIAFHDQRIVVFAKLLCWATELCAERRLTVASRFHLDPGTLANHHCRG